MAVKFPLKMADGTMVRTIEELREHFDLTSVLTHYNSDRLAKWLENGFYDKEAKRVAELDRTSADLVERLCEILGVKCLESEVAQVNWDAIVERNRRIERLKQFTADDEILAAVDRVAFTQTELDDLVLRYSYPADMWLSEMPPLDRRLGNKVYLLGDYFTISLCRSYITYIGVNRPKIALAPERSVWLLPSPFEIGQGVAFHNVAFDAESFAKHGYTGDHLKEMLELHGNLSESPGQTLFN